MIDRGRRGGGQVAKAMLDSHLVVPAEDQRVLKAIDRALAELRRGATLLIENGEGEAALMQAAEVASDQQLRDLAELAGTAPALLITGRRAWALGLPLLVEDGQEPRNEATHSHIVALSLGDMTADRVRVISDPTRPSAGLGEKSASADICKALGLAAVELSKLARLLPAALIAKLSIGQAADAGAWAARHDIFAVSVSDITGYREAGAHGLVRAAEARVPLANAENTRIIAFRPPDGGSEHMAMVIGEPDPASAVLVRVHSECFTGDLLASLRCDCGDQLRGAIETIGAETAGVILYLTQEGRGIGLVNKLRAYALQDQGADTAVANETLGFDADERIYLPAAEMLRHLGISRVRLLTNNPEKVAALTRCGIAVDERVPHAFPSNGHNAHYLATKVRRFGHMI